MKKIVCFFLLATLLPLTTSSEIIKYGSLWYNLQYSSACDCITAEVVASQDDPYSGIITIPQSFYRGETCIVTSIGNSAFEGCVDVTSVSIPSSVTSIGNAAFWQCSSLESVYIPEGVTTIGEGAFHNCFNLVSVVLPSSVTSIGNSAFSNCNNLSQVISRIQNPFSINNNVFTTYSTTTLVIPKGTKSAYQAKTGWKKFTNINDDPSKLTIHVATAGTLSLFIPDDNKYQIEELTLSGELNGTDFRLIRDMAGVSCNFKKYQGAFYPETNGILKSLDISNIHIVEGGNGYTIVDEDYYYGSGGTSFPENYYDLNTKHNCISTLLFYKTKFKSIILPNSVTIIEGEAFKECSALTSVTIPNEVTSIGSSAFAYCYSLSSVTIPQSVKSIGSFAFGGCSGLNSIVVERGNFYYDSRNDCNAIIETSSNTLLFGSNNTIIPNSVTSIKDAAFYGSGLSSVIIPNSVTFIGERAFENCSDLTSVTISNNVNSIGYKTFYGCSSLSSVTIGNSITTIGYSAFENCSSLYSLTIPNNVTSIGSNAFYNTGWYNSQANDVLYLDKWLICHKGNMPDIIIGYRIAEGTKGIAAHALEYCSDLTCIEIPRSVKYIGYGAFFGCSVWGIKRIG